MEIISADPSDKQSWNKFVINHYPPVGAFMQSWEWGEFQKNLGRKINRYLVMASGEPRAAFTLVRHNLPFGHAYGYLPRGPVIETQTAENPIEILNTIKNWAKSKFPELTFLRLEPPLATLPVNASAHGFHIPSYYIQPRHNTAIAVDKNLEEIAAGFHSSTRSNLKRAENRGVTVVLKSKLEESDFEEFFKMIKDTTARNSGKNVYPSRSYFNSLIQTIPAIGARHDPKSLGLGIFCGYQDNKPAAINFVFFFGGTATYLFGASYSDRLRSKVTTYLHWSAMQEARKRGLRFYDLGGIDEIRWPTLTEFKRQFRGQEFRYLGNLDIPIRPTLHRIYDFWRRFKNS